MNPSLLAPKTDPGADQIGAESQTSTIAYLRAVEGKSKAFAGASILLCLAAALQPETWAPIPGFPLESAAYMRCSGKQQFAVRDRLADENGDSKVGATNGEDGAKTRQIPRVAVAGRIVGQDGNSVAGATVRVDRVAKARVGDLQRWIDTVQGGRFRAADGYLIDSARATAGERELTATSDAQGRFRLGEFGAEQVLSLKIQGPTITSIAVSVITRRTEPIAACGTWIYGAEFVITATPTRPVEGVVRDAETRQPLGGVEIRTDRLPGPAWMTSKGLSATTDIQGRFRLVGLPKRWEKGIAVIPQAHQPYFGQRVTVANSTVFDLLLIGPLNESNRIPRAGKNLVVVAAVSGLFHIRIFDDRGQVVANAKLRLPGQTQDLASRVLNKQLEGLWPPHELTRGEKNRIISFVQSIADYPLPEPPDLAPVQLDIELHRGIWIEGKVTSKESRTPVAGVPIRYTPLVDNRFARLLPEFVDLNNRGEFYEYMGEPGYLSQNRTTMDGTYRIVGLPGRGILRVLLSDQPYLQEGYGGLDAQGRFQIYASTLPIFLLREPGKRIPTPVKEINPVERAGNFHVDFVLEAGTKVRLRAVDSQGEPVSGARVTFVIPHDRLFSDQRASAEFDVTALGPNEVRLVLIHHADRKLGKAIYVRPDADKNGPVLVTLEPLSAIEGRATEADGEPAAAVVIRTRAYRQSSLRLGEVMTDSEGRFMVSEVPVGCQYEVGADDVVSDSGGSSSIHRYAEAPKPISVRAGQITNVGTIRFVPVE